MWRGKNLRFAESPQSPCEPTNCERFRFEVRLPDGFWDGHQGALEVSVRWPIIEALNYRESGWFGLSLRDATGGLLAEGQGYTAQVILVPNAPSGVYEATIIASAGDDYYNEGSRPKNAAATYEGVVQVEARAAKPGAPRDLLPDLITMQPMSLQIVDYSGTAPEAVKAATGIKGCRPYEIVEAQAKRCLRFQNTLANNGEGSFEVRLSDVQGTASLAGQGRFVQRIYRADDSFHDEPGGMAAYHPTHEHIHYQGLTRFAVHRFDLATGERGELVGGGHKYGFCSGDVGLISLGALGTTLPNKWTGCGVPETGTYASMGISPGWYDAYSASRDDQFVEMKGVPDGVYELASVVDPDHTVHEADRTNNEASVVFRLTGEKIEVLSSTGHPLNTPGSS